MIKKHQHMSQEKKPPTFHCTGWLIWILIMAYYNPYIWLGSLSSAIYPINNQGPLFHYSHDNGTPKTRYAAKALSLGWILISYLPRWKFYCIQLALSFLLHHVSYIDILPGKALTQHNELSAAQSLLSSTFFHPKAWLNSKRFFYLFEKATPEVSAQLNPGWSMMGYWKMVYEKIPINLFQARGS